MMMKGEEKKGDKKVTIKKGGPKKKLRRTCS